MIEGEIDGRAWAEQRVMFYLAGYVAQRRCRRGSSEGWAKLVSREEQTAYHEAGHAVAAAFSGLYVYAATIVPDPNRVIKKTLMSGGRVTCGSEPTSEVTATKPTERTKGESDFGMASGLLMLLAPQYKWQSALRTAKYLRARTELLIERHWPIVTSLAQELLRKKDLEQSEIERFIGRVRPLPNLGAVGSTTDREAASRRLPPDAPRPVFVN